MCYQQCWYGLIGALEEVSDVDIRQPETTSLGAPSDANGLAFDASASSGHIVNMSSTAGLVDLVEAASLWH